MQLDGLTPACSNILKASELTDYKVLKYPQHYSTS